MSITRSVIRKIARVLDLELAILNTSHEDLGETKSAMVLDTHAKAMRRIENMLPSGVSLDEAIEQAQVHLAQEQAESQRGRDARRQRQRERIAEKQAALG